MAKDKAAKKRPLKIAASGPALALRLCDLANTAPLKDTLKEWGLSEKRYREVLADPDFAEEVWNSGLKFLVVPRIPKVLHALMDRAESGDATSIKLLMQVLQKLKPEQHAHLHLQLQHMDEKALDDRIVQITREIKSIEKEAI